MNSFTKILKKRAEEERRYFLHPQKYAQRIKVQAKKILDSPQVFLFGSVVKGKQTPASDIDLLIVSPSTPKAQKERAEIKAKLYQTIGFFSPFEIHLITPEEFTWYQRFIDKKVEI